jgi:uncharacterized RDD family membrane protein YckC
MDVANQPPAEKPAEATTTEASWGMGVFSILLLFPIFLFLTFHIGAGYLSYQKYGSFLWAIVDFIFAYFYYPYYAFFLASEPSPQSMMGGRKRGGIMKAFKFLG